MEKNFKEKIYKVIEGSRFDQKKCDEIVLKVIELIQENKCNTTEAFYIYTVMYSFTQQTLTMNIMKREKEWK